MPYREFIDVFVLINKSQQTPDKDENDWDENSWRGFEWSVQFLNRCNITIIINSARHLKEPGLGRIGKLLNCLDCLIRPQLRAVLALALVAHLEPVDVIGQGGAFVSRIYSAFLFVWLIRTTSDLPLPPSVDHTQPLGIGIIRNRNFGKKNNNCSSKSFGFKVYQCVCFRRAPLCSGRTFARTDLT